MMERLRCGCAGCLEEAGEDADPPRHATITPRQRIVLRREMARQPEELEGFGAPLVLEEWSHVYAGTVHLKNFKSFPKVEDMINPCVECGFCEPVCPSAAHMSTASY